MPRLLKSIFARCLLSSLVMGAVRAMAADAVFVRGINLNGPPIEIDRRGWEGTNAAGVVVQGKLFENQAVALKPATDPNRARMLRSSVWGSSVDVTISGLSEGIHQVVLYVWEDNHSEQFDLLVNDRSVLEKFHSGAAGAWRKLGPWSALPREGVLKISARGPSHGAANLSGIEIWSGEGAIPLPFRGEFATTANPEQSEFFERRIRPVLVEHCYECHSAGARKLKGGLVLDTKAGVRAGGDTGPAIEPGAPDSSLLIQAVRHADPDMAMPPKGKLSQAILADLEAWVRMGAPDPRVDASNSVLVAKPTLDLGKAREWWSLRPLVDPKIPAVSDSAWPRGELDSFVLARLEASGSKPGPDAEKGVLLRRVTYDLTGLPPTPDELDAFVQDSTPGAFERVVERLLASPRYGERWGRHWLDVVRYADTAGDNSDFPIPQMYRYRDWVIRAFNRDLPYDQFVREQLAGDLLPASTPEQGLERLVATGYIANARRFGSRVDDYPQHLTIEDTLDNLGRTFLGLSLNCARCHDHKFDPITTADYYALYGVFHNTRYPWPGIELEQRQRDLVPMVEPGALAWAEGVLKEREAEKRRLEKVVQKSKESLKDTSETRKAQAEAELKSAEKALKEFLAKGLPFEWAYAVAENRKSENVAIQIKGDPSKPGQVVPRRFLSVLGGQPLPEGETSSGRRQLAEWILDRQNPLTARVMVNRIWLHHFGKGLVPTPNDFGRQGKPPTHPELLDWLATRFVDSGWSIKAMHRLILSSRVYQMASQRRAEDVARDPNNEGLGAFPRRRLDAESLRDTLLVLGGTLDTSPPEPHPFPPQTEWKFTQHNPFKAVYESRRRGVYLMTQRIQRHPYLALFDGADPSASTAVRTSSTTPLQALFLLNDSFVHEQGAAFARRIQFAGADDPTRLQFAYRTALGRPADAVEIERCTEFLGSLRRQLANSAMAPEAVEAECWRALVRSLVRLNEFAYLD
jgi:mono/diheme cytochrome c family protein